MKTANQLKRVRKLSLNNNFLSSLRLTKKVPKKLQFHSLKGYKLPNKKRIKQ